MEHKSTQTSSSKMGKLLEECRAVPQNPGNVSGPPLVPQEPEVLSLLSLWGHLSPVCVSAPGSGFSIHDTWSLRALETDQGLLVPRFLSLGAADLMGHPVRRVAGWAGSHGPAHSRLRLREQALDTGMSFRFPQERPSTTTPWEILGMSMWVNMVCMQ